MNQQKEQANYNIQTEYAIAELTRILRTSDPCLAEQLLYELRNLEPAFAEGVLHIAGHAQ